MMLINVFTTILRITQVFIYLYFDDMLIIVAKIEIVFETMKFLGSKVAFVFWLFAES